jgi:hypothetical protein
MQRREEQTGEHDHPPGSLPELEQQGQQSGDSLKRVGINESSNPEGKNEEQ